MLTKEYPKNGFEQDVVYARKIYSYLKNNPSLVKFVKRTMNKRFRKSWNNKNFDVNLQYENIS